MFKASVISIANSASLGFNSGIFSLRPTIKREEYRDRGNRSRENKQGGGNKKRKMEE